MDDSPSQEINIALASEFRKELKALKKRYRNIRRDIEPIITELQRGNLLGTQISGTDYSVFKVRVRNRDVKKGKSGGYRLIYQLKSSDSILVLTLYSKSDVDSVTAQVLTEIIAEHKSNQE